MPVKHSQASVCRIVEPTPTVDAVLATVASQPGVAVLDSADVGLPHGRYTIVARHPLEVLSCDPGGPDPFEHMRRRLRQTRLGEAVATHFARPTAFAGGWIGYFAYEAGRYIERLPVTTAADVGLPVARFALYTDAAIHDTLTGRWTVFALAPEVIGVSGSSAPSPMEALTGWEALLARAEPVALPPPPPAIVPTVHNMSKDRYLQKVERIRSYIADGDVFQVNLARRLRIATCEPTIHTYRRLRQVNPAAYAAFLTLPDTATATPDLPTPAILSASPELFLQLRDGQVMTRPIKGTCPRSADPVVDAANRARLSVSRKDRAELAMIVDLERNDLGRVCEFGSIHVLHQPASSAAPYDLETHPTVHHLVATVTGRLAPGRDAIDLVRACFPGGSITGAPKVRAMEIIDELEPTERSVYTGAIGYFGIDGSMSLNIAIRTIIAARGYNYVYAGGGIVTDSVPEDEYEETRVKVRGLCQVLGIDETAANHENRPARRFVLHSDAASRSIANLHAKELKANG